MRVFAYALAAALSLVLHGCMEEENVCDASAKATKEECEAAAGKDCCECTKKEGETSKKMYRVGSSDPQKEGGC